MKAVAYTMPVKGVSPVYLFAFGDLQFGTKGFDEELWEKFKSEFKSTPNAYALGLGDYSDFIRPTIRKEMLSALAGDQSAKEELDSLVHAQTRKISEKLDFLAGKIVGLHTGHHTWEFSSGMNSDQLLCQYLRCQYLGFAAYTVLKLADKRSYESGGRAIKIWSTHGSGNALFPSTDLRNLEAKIAPYWNADIYLRGHSSKLIMEPVEYYDVTVRGKPQVVKRKKWLINCGGFSNGYVDGFSSYVEKSNMPPAARGYAVIKIRLYQQDRKIWNYEIQPTLCSP